MTGLTRLTRLTESARFAVRGVTANPMRSALTTLGILIGVAAVIVLVAVGTGSSVAVQESISRLGTNTLTVSASQGGTGGRGGRVLPARRRRPQPPGGGAQGGTSGSVDTGTQTRVAQLTLDDAQALTDRSQAPHVVSVAPVVSAQSVVATYAGATHTVSTFTGSTPSFLVNDNSRVQAGSAFTDSDYTGHRRVRASSASASPPTWWAATGSPSSAGPCSSTASTSPWPGSSRRRAAPDRQDGDDRVIALPDGLTRRRPERRFPAAPAFPSGPLRPGCPPSGRPPAPT